MSLSLEHLFLLAGQDNVEEFRRGLVQAAKEGLDINRRIVYKSLLDKAAENDCALNIRELIDEGRAGREARFCLINATNEAGCNALHRSCCAGNESATLELLEHSGKRAGFDAIFAQINKIGWIGWTPFHYQACTREIVRALLSRAEELHGKEGRYRLVHSLMSTGDSILHMATLSKIEGLMQYCTRDEMEFLLLTKNANGQSILFSNHNPSVIRQLFSISHARLFHLYHLPPNSSTT